MNGGQGTRHPNCVAQLGQSHIGLFLDQLDKPAPVRVGKLWLASRTVVTRPDVAGAPPLLEELFHHPQ